MNGVLFSAWFQIITSGVQIISVLVVLWCIRKWKRLIRDLVLSRDAAEDALDRARDLHLKTLERMVRMQQALFLIAAPQRPDGTWNRSREACRELAQSAIDEEEAT